MIGGFLIEGGVGTTTPTLKRILLNSSVQPLMLGKVTIESHGWANVNSEP